MRWLLLTLQALSLIAFTISDSFSDDWGHWRGPYRDGSTMELSGWQHGTWAFENELWRTAVGVGGSSPIVVGESLYAFSWSDGHERLSCLSVVDGKEVWQQSYRAPERGRFATGDEGLYAGPSSTPEYDFETGKIYSLGNDGDLKCWDSNDGGRLVWEKNLYDAYRIEQRPKVARSPLRDYGFTSSPIVMGNLLIVEVGGPAGTIVAFEKSSGVEKWRSQSAWLAGHSGGPAILSIDGAPYVASFAFNGLLVAAVAGELPGDTIAAVEWQTNFAQHIASPFVRGNEVVITAGYNQHRIVKYRIANRRANVAWETDAHSTICSPVFHHGSLYWACQNLHRVDFETGKLLWKQENTGDAGSCIVTADDKLIVWCNRGQLLLVELPADNDHEPHVLATRKFDGLQDVWPHAVLANQRLFLRDRVGTLICCGSK